MQCCWLLWQLECWILILIINHLYWHTCWMCTLTPFHEVGLSMMCIHCVHTLRKRIFSRMSVMCDAIIVRSSTGREKMRSWSVIAILCQFECCFAVCCKNVTSNSGSEITNSIHCYIFYCVMFFIIGIFNIICNYLRINNDITWYNDYK
jgi:hypothetical protein